ncbi:hypothetical protein BT63DRAFT_409483 [Microthyrium microscopicum]|uniref:YTH domain-containing protein n=1 Tax=Microthyrium microscopicum TaxID=703497 RepID=A0A6A6UT12_9PEZI|nr:hypothetical protein BT63DRAFT_409483 [Microthyrium microscopicum]
MSFWYPAPPHNLSSAHEAQDAPKIHETRAEDEEMRDALTVEASHDLGAPYLHASEQNIDTRLTKMRVVPEKEIIVPIISDDSVPTPTMSRFSGESVAYFMHRPSQKSYIAESIKDSTYLLSERHQKKLAQAFLEHDRVFIIFFDIAPAKEKNGTFEGLAQVKSAPIRSSVVPYPPWHRHQHRKNYPFRLEWLATEPVGFWENPPLLRALQDSFSTAKHFKEWPWFHSIDMGLGHAVAEGLCAKAAAATDNRETSTPSEAALIEG